MLKLYNSLTNSLTEFHPIVAKQAKVYDCGPTVYTTAHIGNMLRNITSDKLRRYLEYLGYQVTQVMNITDVGHLTSDADYGDDKIEKAAQQAHVDPYQLTKKYTDIFLQDLQHLRIQRPHFLPKATEHIPDMIELIQQLVKNGFTYELADGVYFNTQKFTSYGELSGNSIDQIKAGSRIETNPDKKHPADFALWKFVDQNHIMKWDSPWGDGKPGCPGWHIECSAMSMKYLGHHFDIHSGGEDNLFPHHECEIAQSEGATHEKFVNYWIHTKWLLVDGQKMSKSLGNIYTLADLIDKGHDPLAYRLLCYSAHHHKQMNFTFRSLTQAQDGIKRLNNFIRIVLELATANTDTDDHPTHTEITTLTEKCEQDFNHHMDDDLNTPGALAVIYEYVRHIHHLITKNKLNPADAQNIIAWMKKFNSIFAILDFDTTTSITPEIQALIDRRAQARAEKDWKQADKLREQLIKAGVDIHDQ